MTPSTGGDSVLATPRDVELALPFEEPEGEFRLYLLTLPFLPESKNKWHNWPKEWVSGAKNKWARSILKQVQEQQIPLGVDRVAVAAKLVFATKPPANGQQRDVHNYSSMLWDFTADILQYCSYDCWRARTDTAYVCPHNRRAVRRKCGVIYDDSEGHLIVGEHMGIVFDYDLNQAVPKKKRERTIIGVTMKVPTGRAGR